jgi:hypothetical protein
MKIAQQGWALFESHTTLNAFQSRVSKSCMRPALVLAFVLCRETLQTSLLLSLWSFAQRRRPPAHRVRELLIVFVSQPPISIFRIPFRAARLCYLCGSSCALPSLRCTMSSRSHASSLPPISAQDILRQHASQVGRDHRQETEKQRARQLEGEKSEAERVERRAMRRPSQYSSS